MNEGMEEESLHQLKATELSCQVFQSVFQRKLFSWV